MSSLFRSLPRPTFLRAVVAWLALSAALPEVMPASSGGAMVPLVFAQDDLESGTTKVSVVEPLPEV